MLLTLLLLVACSTEAPVAPETLFGNQTSWSTEEEDTVIAWCSDGCHCGDVDEQWCLWLKELGDWYTAALTVEVFADGYLVGHLTEYESQTIEAQCLDGINPPEWAISPCRLLSGDVEGHLFNLWRY